MNSHVGWIPSPQDLADAGRSDSCGLSLFPCLNFHHEGPLMSTRTVFFRNCAAASAFSLHWCQSQRWVRTISAEDVRLEWRRQRPETASEWSNTPAWFRLTAWTILSLSSLNSSSYLQRCIKHALWMKTKRWDLICQGPFHRSYLHSRHPLSPARNPQRRRETSALIHTGKSSETARVTEESSVSSSTPLGFLLSHSPSPCSYLLSHILKWCLWVLSDIYGFPLPL